MSKTSAALFRNITGFPRLQAGRFKGSEAEAVSRSREPMSFGLSSDPALGRDLSGRLRGCFSLALVAQSQWSVDRQVSK